MTPKEFKRLYRIITILLERGIDELVPARYQPWPGRLARRSLFWLKNQQPDLSRGARIRLAPRAQANDDEGHILQPVLPAPGSSLRQRGMTDGENGERRRPTDIERTQKTDEALRLMHRRRRQIQRIGQAPTQIGALAISNRPLGAQP